MTTKPKHYDAIIIGTGQGGVPLAHALAGAGWKTAILEKKYVGGTCINVGCTPTKTMVASARVAYLARRAADYGVHTGRVRIDLRRVRRRKSDIVRSFRNGSESSLEATRNLDLIFGTAAFVGRKTLSLRPHGGGATRTLAADVIVINTGCRPRSASTPGIDQVRTLDSTSIMELERVPRHLAVLGGGYVGLEFGQMFRRFGSQVTVIQHAPHVLGREDEDVATAVEEILREDGVEVLLEAELESVAKHGRGRLALSLRTKRARRRIIADELLVATGRIPNTDGLGAAEAGIALDKNGFVVVNQRLATSAKDIYAIGDVKGGPAFTHISWDDHRILTTNLIGRGGASIAGRLVPYTVYIDPQLGRVGMTETEARESGRSIKVTTMPMSSVARAIETDETRGFLKVVVDAKTDRILGASVLGIEGGEIMSALEIAMMGKLPHTALRDGIFAHPGLMEAFNNLFQSFDG
jgi:pyruvate/2-oxoglutarate dehydrogenase complex dihydrolipoamide dehydrogenase (E3) component